MNQCQPKTDRWVVAAKVVKKKFKIELEANDTTLCHIFQRKIQFSLHYYSRQRGVGRGRIQLLGLQLIIPNKIIKNANKK